MGTSNNTDQTVYGNTHTTCINARKMANTDASAATNAKEKMNDTAEKNIISTSIHTTPIVSIELIRIHMLIATTVNSTDKNMTSMPLATLILIPKSI